MVQRLYGFMTLFQLIVFVPLFSEKHADRANNNSGSPRVVSGTRRSAAGSDGYRAWTAVWFLKAEQVKWMCKILWLVALFCISFANNSVQINLVIIYDLYFTHFTHFTRWFMMIRNIDF